VSFTTATSAATSAASIKSITLIAFLLETDNAEE